MIDDWMTATLGEVAEIRGGGTPSTKEPSYWAGDVVWLTPTEVVKSDGQWIDTSERTITYQGLENSSAKLLPAGAVLLTTRASVGYVALARVSLATNQGFQSLIPGDGLLSEFLMYWIQGNRIEFTSRAGGSTFPEISKKKVAGIPIVVPPLAVQRRIVDLMAHLDTHITNLEVERDSLVTARIAAAETLISNCDAAEVKLGDVLDIARGGSPRPIDDYFTEEPDGLNWIKIGDVPSDGRYITRTAQKIRKEGLSKTRAVRAGDFLLSNSMSFGRPYILKIDGCIHDGWLVLTDTKSQFNQEFLYYLLRSKSVQSQFISLAAGSGVKNLNIKVVRSVTIPLPDRQSQTEMAESLSALFESTDDLDREILALQRIRSQILSTVLCGDFLIRDAYDSLLSEVA